MERSLIVVPAQTSNESPKQPQSNGTGSSPTKQILHHENLSQTLRNISPIDFGLNSSFEIDEESAKQPKKERKLKGAKTKKKRTSTLALDTPPHADVSQPKLKKKEKPQPKTKTKGTSLPPETTTTSSPPQIKTKLKKALPKSSLPPKSSPPPKSSLPPKLSQSPKFSQSPPPNPEPEPRKRKEFSGLAETNGPTQSKRIRIGLSRSARVAPLHPKI